MTARSASRIVPTSRWRVTHPDAGLVVSEPTMGRLSGKWGIALSRRIAAPDGSFAGIVSAILTTDSFGKVFAALELGAQGTVSIRSANLALVYRHPLPQKSSWQTGTAPYSKRLGDIVGAQHDEGRFTYAAADGVERTVTVRKVRSYPLYVTTSFATQDILGDWRRNSAILGALVAVVLAVTVLSSMRLYRAATALRTSETRWNFALAGSGQGVWDWDIANHTAFYSLKYKELLGYGAREIGDSENEWSERIHPDDRARIFEVIERHLRGDTPVYVVEFRMRHKDGHDVWIEARGMAIERTAQGRAARMVGTISDISERKERERALQVANERLSMAERAAGAGAWDWDIATGNLYWSDAFFQLLGRDRAGTEASFDTWRATMHPDDLQEAERRLSEALASRRPLFNRYRIVRPGGEVRWIEAHGDMEYDAAGNPLRMTGFCVDVTARHAAEAELEERRRQVELLNVQLAQRVIDAETGTRTREAFLRAVGHEFRTPMNHVSGLTHLLLGRSPDPKSEKWLRQIQESAQAMTRLVNDTIDVAALESGTMKLERVEFSPATVVTDARLMTARRATAKGLEFDVRVDGDVPLRAYGDPGRIAQALLNYLDNAIKFTERGTVTLLAERVEPATTTGDRTVMLRFTVRDTGIGIASQENLFAAFSQGDSSLTRPHGGLGVGLFNTRQLARLMGGDAGFSSVPGEGSAFWFTVAVESD